ncbi:MAG TPA: glycoside hydrolase family 3 C-terminal domain-containing protein, partial [Acidimicrobiales bacterium]
SMVHQALSDLTYFGAAGYVPAIPSLCVPPLTLNDAGSGLGDGQIGVTAYPAGIAQAASWDPALQFRLGQSLGGESAAKGINVLLAPDVNIARVPSDGRTSEQFGEDPYLSGQTAVAYIRGVQSQHVIATVKHYAANNQETNRAAVDELISDRTLHEIYEPAFAAAVTQGGVGAVMCAYNQVNRAYACQNPTLIRTDLEAQDGFTGFVMSDWGATHSTVASALAGLDQEMDVIQTPDALETVVPPNPGAEDYYGAPLTTAVATGQVPMKVLDDMVGRILRSMFAIGLFDHPVRSEPAAFGADADTAANRQVALAGAEAGTVLLRDQGGVLPLTSRDHTIAVIGPDATVAGAATVAQAGGSVHVNQPLVAAPLDAIRARAAQAGDTVVYDGGGSPAAAAAVARTADVAVVYAGYSEAEGADQPNLGFNQGLACSLSCVSVGSDSDQLIAAVAAANPHTVVVLNTGGPVLMPWIDRVAGVVEAWYPGEEDGTAAAAVLFGDVDPGGKLPITFPRSTADLPTRTAAQYPGVGGVATYGEGLDVGYRWYDAKGIAPLFPFGFGLS